MVIGRSAIMRFISSIFFLLRVASTISIFIDPRNPNPVVMFPVEKALPYHKKGGFARKAHLDQERFRLETI
jgi:hypothetical protein